MKNYYKGLFAEFIVKLLLYCKGYKILASRYKTKLGEIDLVCSKKGSVVFVEVKSRKRREDFLDVITKKQIFRIIRASQLFLQRYKAADLQVRYDVVFISYPFYFRHIKNAFC